MPIHQIDPAQAKQLQSEGAAVIIDLRAPDQFSKEHISGAQNIPSDSVTAENLPDIGDKKLIVHCNRGGRATRWCNSVIAEDQDVEIHHLQGGIEAWKAAGFAVDEINE